MARCDSESDSGNDSETSQSNAAPTIDDATRRLGVESATAVARAVLEAAGDRPFRRFGRPATVAAAVRIASRRTEGPTVGLERIVPALAVDPGRVERAEARLTAALSEPADPDEIRTLRRRLVVAHELLAACEAGRRRPELPGSRLADAAPDLLARVDGPAGHCADLEGLEGSPAAEPRLRAHVERLEADLELARLGTTLYARLEDDCRR
ncbi:hypothetical protein SAMN05444422_101414 [Halobiforma haloterrestris]|uniref:Uncharacterized protein n=1 Tax=Natronobacterium haloterrestre TaxID=148448 RepID=A0A1I1DFY1_NATHA|nr:hypothetical protein [Halobiforma haloterrestris]SFB71433.1 hypothetical protein SAMN05444422_101414 [Halobiforma haloterrestris]